MTAAITLLHTLLLPDFPSASAVEYLEGKLYLVGDDATCILVLDRDYQITQSISIADAVTKRIAKAEKPDFEASALITLHGQHYLLASGSLATEKRRQILLVPLTAPGNIKRISYPDTFITQLLGSGIHELNVEGATVVGDTLLLSNRGNDTYPLNQLILIPNGFWEQESVPAFSVVPLTLLTPTQVFAGVSELCYVAEKDLLLCTLSSEATANAYDDGAIGDSYIGWIKDISQKLSGASLAMDGWLNLVEADAAFTTQKIEGICLEQIDGDQLILHLVADNDGGDSRLFKVSLSLA